MGDAATVDQLSEKFADLRRLQNLGTPKPGASVFNEAIEMALGKEAFEQLKDSPLAKAGRDLAKLSDLEVAHAYHNGVHAQEAMLSAAALAKEQFKNLAPVERNQTILRAVTAMAGHDLGHDGGINGQATPQRLEKLAGSMTEKVLASHGIAPDSADGKILREVIHGTDPTLVKGNFERFGAIKSLATHTEQSAAVALTAVANAADILPSTLSGHGSMLGEKLSAEWVSALSSPSLPDGFKPPEGMARGAATAGGRAFFLEHVSREVMSLDAMEAIGAKANWSQQLKALSTIGLSALPPGAPVPPAAELSIAGGRHLSSLPKVEADALFEKHLASAAAPASMAPAAKAAKGQAAEVAAKAVEPAKAAPSAPKAANSPTTQKQPQKPAQAPVATAERVGVASAEKAGVATAEKAGIATAEKVAVKEGAAVAGKVLGKALPIVGGAIIFADSAMAASSAYNNAKAGHIKDASIDAARSGLKAVFGVATQLANITLVGGVAIAAAGEGVDYGLRQSKDNPKDAESTTPSAPPPINKEALAARRQESEASAPQQAPVAKI